MRIALLNHTFASTDGQGKVNARVASYLLDAGHRVTLVGDGVPGELAQRPGAAVVSLPPSRRLPTQLLRHAAFGWRSAAAISKLRKDHDLIVANGGMTFAPTDVNICHFVHQSWLRSDQHPLRSGSRVGRTWGWYQYAYTRQACLWERDAYRRARCVTAVSELVKQQLVSDVGIDAAKITVIENGVDPCEAPTGADRAEARGRLGIDDGQFVILFAGDLRTPRKNFDVLLRALRNLPERVVLVAAGNHEGGPYPALTKEAGLAARVRFLGMRGDMSAIYPAGDLFALLSHYDPFGLVVTEAMSAGLPVVTASTVGASAVVVKHNAGFVIDDPTNDVAVARAITKLLDNPDLASTMGVNAREVAKDLSWDCVGERYAQTFLAVAEQRRVGKELTTP